MNGMKRFLQFCLVGGSGVFVDTAVLYVLIDPRCLGVSLILGKICAGQTAMVSNFIWNDLWTFRDLASGDPTRRGRWRRFVKFDAVCSFGLLLSVVLLHIQVVRFGFNPYAANILAIGAATFWNYGINRFFNWGRETPEKRLA
jgi:dolichol-phosphate mannosyltransferase